MTTRVEIPPWRVVVRFVWPVIIGAVAIRLFVAARHHAPEAHLGASLAWTALLLMAFTGWGSAAAFLVSRDDEADVGLRATWGMGIALAYGGVLVLFRAASVHTLGAFVVVGLAFLVGHAVLRSATEPERLRQLGREIRRTPWLFGGLVFIALLCVTQAVAAVYDVAEWGVSDDAPAYAVFPKQILEAGSFDQPFSFRRLSAYGGQSLLQAFFLLELGVQRLHLFDRGLCTAVVVLLVAGAPRKQFRVPHELILLPLLLVVTLEDVRQNLASEMSGVVFILGLYRTMRWGPLERGAHGVGSAVLLALVGAGALTLRQNYAGAVIPILAFGYTASFLSSPTPLRERVRELRAPALTMAFSFLFLLPWAIAAQRACGSYLYPFKHGNYNAGIGFEAVSDLLVRLQLYWYNVTHSFPIASVHAFVLAGFIVRDRSHRRAMVAVLVGALLGFGALLCFAWQANPDDYKRYYFGFEVALVCAVTLAAFEHDESDASADPTARPAPWPTWPAVLVVFACFWQLFSNLAATQKTLGAATVMRLQSEEKTPTVPTENDEDRVYTRLQTSIPEHATVLVMLDEPYRLDFARNTIDIINLPGVVSPPPTMPTTDPDALASYLVAHGIHHLAFVRKSASKHLYSEGIWTTHLHGKGDIPQHHMARVTLDVLNGIDALATRRKHLFDEAGMVVLDLDTP